MAQTLNLEIVTPQRVVLSKQADYVTIPGLMGELGILPGHIPILTEIYSGVLVYKEQGAEKKIAVHHGFAEVFKDKITVLIKLAEQAEEINKDRANNAHDKVDGLLKSHSDDVDEEMLKSKLFRSLTRQQAGS